EQEQDEQDGSGHATHPGGCPRRLQRGGDQPSRGVSFSSQPRPPRVPSSSSQIAPSGPCSTSRMRRFMSKRSASRADSPSNATRTSDIDDMPPMKPSPLQSGNRSPS